MKRAIEHLAGALEQHWTRPESFYTVLVLWLLAGMLAVLVIL